MSTLKSETEQRPQRPWRGVAYMAVALLLFACLDSMVKYLTAHYPVPLVAWLRYAGQFLLMTALLAPRAGRQLLVTRRPALVSLRSLCLVATTLVMTAALKRLPLAEATSIAFAAPLLVVLLASPLLGERIGMVRTAAVVVGFGGVLLITRPSGDLDTLGVTLALVAAVLSTFYQLLSRLLGGENAVRMLYNSGLLGTVIFGLAAPWFWQGPAPTLEYALLFAGLGIAGGVGHFFLTRAYQEAPASYLAPIGYLQLVWAGLLGWLVFSQLPDLLTLLGMLVVAGSGIVAATFGRRGR